nr:MAG: hypothetical protein [Penaeus monodon endogenous nimavirus]
MATPSLVVIERDSDTATDCIRHWLSSVGEPLVMSVNIYGPFCCNRIAREFAVNIVQQLVQQTSPNLSILSLYATDAIVGSVRRVIISSDGTLSPCKVSMRDGEDTLTYLEHRHVIRESLKLLSVANYRSALVIILSPWGEAVDSSDTTINDSELCFRSVTNYLLDSLF